MRTALVLAAAVGALGCQTYDFEPVRPLAIAQTTQSRTVTATRLTPNVMILLDKSGSMANPINPGGSCNCMFPGCVEATCPTRIGQVRSAMGQFLMGSGGDVARFGLTIYPSGMVCTPAGSSEQLTQIKPANDDSATLKAWSSAINDQIQTQTVVGGTPTGDSLRFVGGIPELNADDARDDFVLLLTDGLPNCNAVNPNSCTAPTTCKCTLAGGNCGTMASDMFCKLGCLDLDGSVQAVKDLRSVAQHAGGIKTIVVGFGSDFGSGDGFDTLNAMAIAGGFSRTCPNSLNSECGTGGVCDTNTKLCQTAFYAAANATELATALLQIRDILNAQTVCTYVLDAAPTTNDLVSVIIDGDATVSGPDTWELNAGTITMKGALCDKLMKSDTAHPVKVEIRVVQAL